MKIEGIKIKNKEVDLKGTITRKRSYRPFRFM